MVEIINRRTGLGAVVALGLGVGGSYFFGDKDSQEAVDTRDFVSEGVVGGDTSQIESSTSDSGEQVEEYGSLGEDSDDFDGYYFNRRDLKTFKEEEVERISSSMSIVSVDYGEILRERGLLVEYNALVEGLVVDQGDEMTHIYVEGIDDLDITVEEEVHTIRYDDGIGQEMSGTTAIALPYDRLDESLLRSVQESLVDYLVNEQSK